MKKSLRSACVALAGVILATTMLTGCGNNGNSTSSGSDVKQTADPKEKAKIRIWARGSGPDAGVSAIIDKFNKEQNDAEAAYEFYGENYANVVQMAIAANSAPEVFEASTGLTVVGLAKNGSIVPIDDIWNDALKKQMHPDTVKPKDFYYQGKLYSIPVRISAYRLLYNKDVFKKAGLDPQKPPKTLEEMRDMAKKITDAGKGEFYGFGLPVGVGQIWERVIDPINMAMGVGDRYGWNSKTGKYDFASNKKLFNYYVQLMKDGSLFPGSLTLGIDPLRANFSQGKVGMYIDGNWMVGNYSVQMKTTADWDVAPLPVFEGSTAGKYWAEGGVNWVVGKSNKVEAAKKFYTTWATSQDLANKFMPAPRTVLAANKEENLPVKDLGLKGIKYSFDTSDLVIPTFEPHKFITLQGDDRNKVLTNLFAKAADTKDISKELDAAIDDLNKRYTEALDKALKDGAIDPNDMK